MATFQNHVLGMLNPADTLTTQFQRVARPNDPLEPLFNDETTPNLVATYHTLASQYQIPQMAQFHAFDVEAQQSIPAPIDEHNVEKGLIKVKRSTSELLRQLMNRGMTNEEQLYDEVMDFASDLANQVVTRARVARAEVMATGQMTIKENNADITIDYGVPSANKNLTLDVGAGASEDVLAQINTIVDNATDAGVTLNGIVTSRTVLSKIRANRGVQKAINGVYAEGVMVSNDALRNWLSSEFGITQVITNDLSYSTPWTLDAYGRPQPHTERYYPKNRISFFGTANNMLFGSSLWGQPPEVDLGISSIVSGSGVNPYVYITQWEEHDPAVLWTKASALFIPVMYNPNSLYIASVIETPGA